MNHGFSRSKVFAFSAFKLFIRAFEKRKIVLPVILNENGTNGKITAEVRICSERSPVAWHLTDRLWQTLRVPKLITLMTNGVLLLLIFLGKLKLIFFIKCTLPRISRLRWTFAGRFDIKILRTACSISHEKLIANFMRGNFSSQPDRKPE